MGIAGCAKYNTYFNAKRAFDDAENVREEAIRKHQDPPTPTGAQKTDYETAIRKAQKILDEYPGHGLTDDALFLQAKARHRLESYRMSIRDFNLLFTNFPATDFMEEALYLQALNYLLLGSAERSQEYLEKLAKQFPESRFQAETRKVTGDNAYDLEEWDQAVSSYREYLELEVPDDERDRVGLKLADCYWELERFGAADSLLSRISIRTASPELAFRARLLRARVLVRRGTFADAEALTAALLGEAEIYRAQGDLALVEAERLVAEGKGDDAVPLLENMPEDWGTPVVKARAADLLGSLFLDRGEWDKAREKYQAALAKKDELDRPERTRRLAESLKDYLAAEQSLPDAKPDQVPRLQLLQANALLFGFDRPAMAADLYGQAAADSAADSTLASRALYGVYVAQKRHLDNPDSAAIAAAELESRFPDSPQAFEVRSGRDSDLLRYLLAEREVEQEQNLAALTPEEREALESVAVAGGDGAGDRGVVGSGFRRRQIYLSRRENLVYPPPEVALGASQTGTRPSGGPAGSPMHRVAVDSLSATLPVAAGGSAATALTAPADSLQTPAPDADLDEKAKEQAKKEEEMKKREQEQNWDFLR